MLRECALGLSAEEIADLYPSITPQDVHAALAFAADYMAREVAFAAE